MIAEVRQEKYEKAKKITFAEAIKQGYTSFYDPFVDEYIYLETIDDLRDEGDLPEWAFGTVKSYISFDASSIIEDACSELHDDALCNIPHKAFEKMQAFLDEWAKEQADATETHTMDWSVVVELPLEEDED